jgi:hypothetical protein
LREDLCDVLRQFDNDQAAMPGGPRMVNVQPVRTAFEGVSKPIQIATEPGRLERLEQVSKILFNAPATDRGVDNGTDADRPKRADLMRLLAGNRHERIEQ